MTTFQRKLTTALATGAVLANAFVPVALADDNLSIVGNGSHSDSNISVNRDTNTDVNQDNTANVNNNVNVNASTGGNRVNDNTGGDVRVRTGDVNTDVNISNLLNKNVAQVDNCGGCEQDVNVEIAGNGTDSNNDVDVDFRNRTDLDQTNRAYVNNNVDVDADTGDNDVKDNTGGDVVVRTGDVDTDIRLRTVANANSARIGGNGGDGGLVSAHILGNGSHSDNNIDLNFDSNIDVNQDNHANINNDVNVDADTGWNNVKDNTGGDVALLTGDVNAKVIVDNLVNFNAADVEDCCFEDLKAKIADNGTDSNNDIDYDSDKDLDVDQDNHANLDNDLYIDGYTGDNDVKDNTGEWDGPSDPFLQTGDVSSDTNVSNEGGLNLYGDVALEFDWADLWDWFNSLDL